MKVLIGVDGSGGGRAAVEFVGRLLSAERDEVGLYYAPPEIRIRDAGPAAEEIRQRAHKALADTVLAEACAALPEPLQTKVHRIVGEKPPRQGLLLAAEEWRAELIVLGAHGAGPLNKVSLGTVSRAVVQHARVPVLVVRCEGQTGSRPPRVLVATDDSPASELAAGLLAGFTWPQGTKSYLLRVFESLLAGNVPAWLEEQARRADDEALAQAWAREHEQEQQQARERLQALARQFPAAMSTSEMLLTEGHPAEQILQTISREGIDLVVVGAHGKSALERFLLGSTSEKVLLHAPCSVLVARQHARP